MASEEGAGSTDQPTKVVQYSLDSTQLHRLAKNTADLLSELMRVKDEYAAKSRDTRTRMQADLKALLAPISPSDRGYLISQLSLEVQRIFDERGSPKVGVTSGCVGTGGFGINATEGNVTAGVCVTGSFATGPTGGGIEGSFRY